LSREAIHRGFDVIGVARRGELLQKMATELGGRFTPITCDVADAVAVQAMCDALQKTPDVLILNAGVGNFDNKHELDLELHRRTFDINYFGALNVIAALFEKMKTRKSGHVVVTSSLAAYRGLPLAAAYCASKAALTTAVESMRLTYGRFGLDFTTIHPGFVKTPMTDTNTDPMPFLWAADKAAIYILDRVERRCKNIVFPLPIRLGSALLRLLPAWLHYKLLHIKGNRRQTD
jgi:NAD(P)-dependent dehydrogenase (short-subunit alcohol dehydrogenase family)